MKDHVFDLLRCYAEVMMITMMMKMLVDRSEIWNVDDDDAAEQLKTDVLLNILVV